MAHKKAHHMAPHRRPAHHEGHHKAGEHGGRKVMHGGREIDHKHPAHPHHEYKIKKHSSHRHMEHGHSSPGVGPAGDYFGEHHPANFDVHTAENRLSKSKGGRYGKDGRPEMDMNQMGEYGGELPSGAMMRYCRKYEQ